MRRHLRTRNPRSPHLCVPPQKLDRVKATDRFAFPLELDMAPYLQQGQQQEGQQAQQGQQGGGPPLVYDLVAILIHKGGSAMHGHYGGAGWLAGWVGAMLQRGARWQQGAC